jgi:hypothetical protein
MPQSSRHAKILVTRRQTEREREISVNCLYPKQTQLSWNSNWIDIHEKRAVTLKKKTTVYELNAPKIFTVKYMDKYVGLLKKIARMDFICCT